MIAQPRLFAPVRRWMLACGLAVLAASWLGPLPTLATERFSAHMAMHVAVVAIAAPLIAIAIAGARADPAVRWPRLFHPLPASVLELVVIWTWHTPVLHQWSRSEPWGMVLEQGAFLAVALWLWLSAFGGAVEVRAQRTAAGIGGLLMTSMHMTLLGVLLALAPRSLFGHEHGAGAHGLGDQQLGGVLMLVGGGVSYLVGGLYLLAGLLAAPATAVRAPRTQSKAS